MGKSKKKKPDRFARAKDIIEIVGVIADIILVIWTLWKG